MADEKPLRFYDNRQKYLSFVSTTNEKWTVAQRVSRELDHIAPEPPAFRLFDAGVGDGVVLANVLRAVHERFPHVPVQVTGKEISVEDLRMALDKVPDRLVEHPPMVFVFTNLLYREAPGLKPSKGEANWMEVPLEGTSSLRFSQQLRGLDAQLVEAWRVSASKSGNPVYATPSVLVLYRADHRFMLDDVIPRAGEERPGYDLMVASQPWRARTDAETKVRNILKPLVEELRPGGRLVVAQSVGNDPGEAIVRGVWDDDEELFPVDRHVSGAGARSGAGQGGGALRADACRPIRTRSSRSECTRCRTRSGLRSGRRRCTPHGTPPRMSRRSTTGAWPSWRARRIWTTPRRCCGATAGCGSTTRRSWSRGSGEGELFEHRFRNGGEALVDLRLVAAAHDDLGGEVAVVPLGVGARSRGPGAPPATSASGPPMMPSPKGQTTERDSIFAPVRRVGTMASSMACMIFGTPAMTWTFSMRKPGAALTRFSMRPRLRHSGHAVARFRQLQTAVGVGVARG